TRWPRDWSSDVCSSDLNTRIKYVGVYNQYEWFAQDTMRVSRRLTLDLGVRFQLPGPVAAERTIFGIFDGKAYQRSQAGQLLYPRSEERRVGKECRSRLW